MRKVILASAAIALLGMGGVATANVQFGLGADDYAQLLINGTQVARYDNISASGGVYSAMLNLTGWQNIDIVYQNRYGSSYLGLTSRSAASGAYDLVPLVNMRSQDANGAWVSGLTARYFNIGSATPIATIYGEGPIEHGARYQGSVLKTYYQGASNFPVAWGPITSGWTTFEERLSGQIYCGAPPAVPEPAFFQMGALLGMSGLGFLKLRRKA